MAQRRARRNGHTAAPAELLKIELACGQRKEPGWVGVDAIKTDVVDVIHDLLDFPWPFADNSAAVVRAHHFIEHIPMLCMCCRDQVDPLFRFFDEVWRVLVPGGQFHVLSPHWSHMRSWQDPTHRRAISEATFMYTWRYWRERNELDHYPIKCDFDLDYRYNVPADFGTLHEAQRQYRLQHCINVISDVPATLIKHELSCERTPEKNVCTCAALERLQAV